MEARAPERESSQMLAAVVFALLVLATFGAFFVTQRLKRATPPVKRIAVPLFVSPNGDGRKDTAHFSFDLPKADDVTVSIVTAGGDEVRRIVDDRRLSKGTHAFVWDGHDSGGAVPADGLYFVRVILRNQARAATGPRGIQLVTKPPHPRLLSVTPARMAPGATGPVTIRFSGSASPPPLYSVYRTDAGPPRLVARFTGPRLSHVGEWDGLVHGHPAPPGTYAFAVTDQNKALVSGSSPRRLPPSAAEARPHTGLTISGPAAAPPLRPVAAGTVARVQMTGARGHVRWSLERLGASRPVRRGVGVAPALRVGVPSSARTGVYLVRMHSGAGNVVVPLAVRGRASGRLLVVLPAIAWQGLNPVDDDGDGFPDTLDGARSVPLGRPFAGGRLPAGFAGSVAPLLEFLDRHHLRYDLTTDLAPRIAGHSGVVLAGSERWIDPVLMRFLPAYVHEGGNVLSFGSDALRRTVEVSATALSRPSPPRRADAFGERTQTAASAAAPLVVYGDTLGVFAGSDGFVGLFTHFDQEQAPPQGARLLARAGRDPRHPAFVAYRLGRGLVVRAGAPQWASRLASDPELSRATTTLWSLLSR